MIFGLLIFVVYLGINYANGNPIIATPYGKILGSYSQSHSGRIYSQFLGVPYAQPPVGNLRFKEPQQLQKWEGIWIANLSSICAQWAHTPDGGSFMGQEDCLHCNIYVPKTQSKALLDVIIDIHGGGLNFGKGTYYTGVKYLMDKDLVFVTFNYRLGPLGFLSTEDEVVPGNNGMKDQVAVIKWVKENIKYFGGNPDSITLSGMSAGGGSVQLHYMSPLTTGLFKGGISTSGTALCPWMLQENALDQSKKLAEAVGCYEKSTKDFINCMQQRPVTQICEQTQIFRPWLYNPFSVFGVVIEKLGENPFLTDHPYKLLVEGRIHDLPWITSHVADEGLYPVAEFMDNVKYLEKLEQDWEELASHILHYEHTIDPKLHSTVAKKIKQYYFKDNAISPETNNNLIQVASDRLFVVDAEKAARLQGKVNKSPTYYYYFTHNSETMYSFTELRNYNFDKKPGVCHGDDLAFLYSTDKIQLKEFTDKDIEMREIMLGIWTSFASTGKPHIQGREWRPVSNELVDQFDYLHISSPDQVVMRQTNDLGNKHFWDSLGFKENERLFLEQNKDEL